MLKTYGIDGQTTAIVKIPFNGNTAWLEVEFKRGRIGTKTQNRPATFSTTDPVEQAIIENSPMFGRMIRLIRCIGSDETPTAKSSAAPAPAPALENHPEITSKDEAVAFLKAHGAKATNLKDDESIMKFAAKIGVRFPNLYE